MPTLLRHRSTPIWLLLMVATAISWWFGADHGAHSEADYARVTIGLLILAFIKVRFVIQSFMEVRHAPIPLRVIGDLWVFGVCTAVIVVFVTSAPV